MTTAGNEKVSQGSKLTPINNQYSMSDQKHLYQHKKDLSVNEILCASQNSNQNRQVVTPAL